ncbi:hypothetical protein HZA73_01160 [candidate division TA06 bacterium]|nr:hypothetical protein [candidate division TA06 bacterium]
MKKIMILALLSAFVTALAFAQVSGTAGAWTDYNSNAFSDASGGGTLTLGAFLDLAADWPFGKSPLSVSADYSGSYSAYLSYLSRSHNDHLADALLVLDIGKDGYAGLGGSFEAQLNSADRKYYDNSSTATILESKIYLANPLLLKLDGSVGRTSFSYFTDYGYNSTGIAGSLSLFLPAKTALIGLVDYNRKVYSSCNDTLAPQNILFFSPRFKLTQSLGQNVGLAVSFGTQQNKVSADSFYMPDTLLREVAEYFDYQGIRAEAQLTVLTPGDNKFVVYGAYNNKDFSSLYAYQKAGSDTSSPFSRAKSENLRKDVITEVGVELTLGLDGSGSKSPSLILGGNYLINSSNDPYYDFSRLLFSASLEYSF